MVHCPDMDQEDTRSSDPATIIVKNKKKRNRTFENLGKDAIRQFAHSSLRKWTLKFEKSSILSGSSAMLGKKLACRRNKQEAITDPFLSPFICNIPVPNANDIHLDEDSSCNKDLDIPDIKRLFSAYLTGMEARKLRNSLHIT